MTDQTGQTTVQAAMIEAMKSIGAVRKDGRNTHQNFMFRGIDAVVNAVSPALQKAGVVVTPKLEKIERREMKTSRGNAMNSIDVIVTYTFTGPSGDTISATVPGEAFDSGDKATAKAMSVAFRIALLQSLALPTDDPDPDGESHSATPGGATMTARQAQTAQAWPAMTSPQAGQAPQGQGVDLNAALQNAWNNPQQLAALRQTVARMENLPDGYLKAIRDREQSLANQNQNR